MATGVETGSGLKLTAGFGRVKVTPPVGVDLTGYIGRPGPAARVHDDLYAAALVLDDGLTRAAIVAVDILGIDMEQDAALRAKVSQATGIDGQNLLFATSHTHAGPAIQDLRRCGTPDDSYLRWGFSQIVAAIQEASQAVRDASLSLVTAQSDLGENRRHWVADQGLQASPTSGVVTDPDVTGLLVRCDGGPSVMVFNYACHGVVMGNENVDVSADWIGAARQVLEASPAVDAAMFLQGCCGDINPRWRGTFDEVKRAGESVAAPLLEALPGAAPVAGGGIRVAWRRVDLPYQPLPEQELLEQEVSYLRGEIQRKSAEGAPRIGLEVDQAMLTWTQDALSAWDKDGGPSKITVGIQAMAIGDVTLVSLPGEAFCELGLQIKAAGKSRVIPVGYANGNVGYIPTAAAYQEGGYETRDAFKYYGLKMIGPESAEIVIAAAIEALAEVEG